MHRTTCVEIKIQVYNKQGGQEERRRRRRSIRSLHKM